MSAPQRIVIWQLLGTAALAAVLFLWELSRGNWGAPWFGLSQTVAVLAAGSACVIPAGYFAWRAKVERSAARLLLQGVVKFALTLFLIAFWIIAIKPAAAGFFGTLVVLQAAYVVVPLTEKQPGAGLGERA